MKKNLLLTICLAFLLATVGTGHTMEIMYNVATAGSPGTVPDLGDLDTLTDPFDQIQFQSQTTTIQYDTDSSGDLSKFDEFLDAGNIEATALLKPGPNDTEGLTLVYELTALWDDVEGYVNDVTGPLENTKIDLIYTSGTLNFYLDTDLDATFANPPGTDPPAGAGGSGFGDDTDGNDTATLVATLTVLDGIGHSYVDLVNQTDIKTQGSVDLLMQFTYMLDDFWLNSAGIDLLDLNPISFHFATTDMNLDTTTQVPEGGALFKAYSNQDGSLLINVVPEPSTMLLLGCGLMGLAFVARRRNRQ